MNSKSPLVTLGYLFYLVSPNKTSFQTIQEVPDYTVEVIPYFMLLTFLEFLISLYKKKPTLRVNDAAGSISQGLFQELVRIPFGGFQLATYIYIYENWRVATLNWNSPWTWWLCFFGVDFAYYWLHRASHEINILWAAHQVHHSSEDYNLSTALRQSVIQDYCVWIFYLPMAFAIPPSVFLVHHQFNLLYQFWIHTELVSSLGPLEYILNTASHHRVHHGRNRYCIDKNYAGTLIIWDRMFGTFEPESEKVVYGLTHPINSFETFYIQFCHYIYIWKTFWGTKGFRNKMSVIFKGPGWSPGTPWHGNLEDIPDVKAPVEKYDPSVPLWCKMYVFLHFLLIIAGYLEIADGREVIPKFVLLSFVAYEVISLSIIGMLLEGRMYAPWAELLRCILYILVDVYIFPYTRICSKDLRYSWLLHLFLRIMFTSSAIFWLQYCVKNVTVKLYPGKITKKE